MATSIDYNFERFFALPGLMSFSSAISSAIKVRETAL